MTPPRVQVDLRPLARVQIGNGSLPFIVPREILASYGEGVACDLCGDPITRTEAEYQITAGGAARILTYRFHAACEAAWETECEGANQPGCPSEGC
jgi:hypothetical protein